MMRVRAGVAAVVVDVLGGLPRMGFAIALCMFMGFMISVSFHDVPVARLGPTGDTSWEPAGRFFFSCCAVAARRRIAATFSYMSVFVAVKALRKLAALREIFAVLYLVVDQEAFGDKAVGHRGGLYFYVQR